MADIITPFGDLVWCGINGDTTVPNTHFDSSSTKIECSIVIEGEEGQHLRQTLEEIVNAGLTALADAEPDPEKKKKIWAKKYVPGTPGEAAGTLVFKFKTTRPPALYDATGEKAPAGENWLIGNGSRGRFSIGTGRAYATGVVSGVGMFLNQIQITELVAPAAGHTGFDPVGEGGFKAASAPPPPFTAAPPATPPATPPANYAAAPPAAPPANYAAAPPPPVPVAVTAAEAVTSPADLAKFADALKGLSTG